MIKYLKSNLGNKYYYDSKFESEILKYKWKENKKGYLMSHINGIYIGLHKFIYQIANKIELKSNLYEIHHKNSDLRNNTLSNLELLNNSNHAKTKQYYIKKSSKYYYVSKVKNSDFFRANVSWTCKELKKHITKHLGKFKDELQAAKIADNFIKNNQHLFLTRKKTNKEHNLY